MPEYRRAFQPGGTFFFTVVTHCRQPFLIAESAREALHRAVDEVRHAHPFGLEAIVLLPDHLHCVWTLPEDDANFSLRWQLIKSRFSRYYRENGGRPATVSLSRREKQEQGFWQRRFWERLVRNEQEYEILCNYIHYNPVKHGYAGCSHRWPYSSFHRYVRENRYGEDWGCACRENPNPVVLPAECDDWAGE